MSWKRASASYAHTPPVDVEMIGWRYTCRPSSAVASSAADLEVTLANSILIRCFRGYRGVLT
jgi:hypothetical protein